MKAIQVVKEKKIEVTDIPEPNQPNDDEVQVKIRVVALNHLDVWGWRGMAFANRELPLTIGAEASGEIVGVGKNVEGLKVGQIVSIYGAKTCLQCEACKSGKDNLCENPQGVHGFHLNGFAQEIVNIPADQAIAAPDKCTDIFAAMAPITFGTPEHMLFDNAKLKSGQSVLVQAGGSGIGTAAIQLAKDVGAMVITTVGSPDKMETCKELGADHIINYHEERFATRTRKITKKIGVDVVFEHVGADTWQDSMLCMKPGGTLVTCGSTSGISAPTNLMMLFQRQLRLIGSFGCTKNNMVSVMQKMTEGLVKPVIDSEIKPEEITQALEKMENRKVFGKIILRMA